MTDLKSLIPSEWQELLADEFEKPYFSELCKRVEAAYADDATEIYPSRENIFSALSLVRPSEIKVVILGQDPYHEPNQAHGLAFSVLPGVKIPPSLRNMYKELEEEYEGCFKAPNHGFLEGWAKQGVLMLNTVLTVEAHKANSHKGWGWENFTDAVIKAVSAQDRPVVFLLWGAPAQKKKKFLSNPKHMILEAAHPSPLSAYRGFFGCKHFTKTNEFLVNFGLEPIDWSLPNII